jgi:phospholipase/carboxylesterase
MSDFIYELAPGSAPTMVLLHGTGGDENDLLPIGRLIAPGATLLGVRGKVLEHGSPRFFRRLSEGVFDLDDLRFRTNELADFLVKQPGPLVALGFSNGANIAAAMLLLRPEVLSAAILLRAMVPLVPDSPPDLSGKRVFLASGIRDPIVPPENASRLAAMLTDYGADVTLKRVNAGHELTRDEIEQAREWLGIKS